LKGLTRELTLPPFVGLAAVAQAQCNASHFVPYPF